MTARKNAETPNEETKEPKVDPAVENARIDKLVKETLAGRHGRDAARKKSLGKDFEEVQKRVLQARRRSGK